MPAAAAGSAPTQKDYTHLDTQWAVPQEREWSTLYRKYKSFKLPGSDEQYKTNQFVYIFPDPEEGSKTKRKKRSKEAANEDDEANDPDADPWWIGLIKEIRAKDEKNVFIVVNWMYTTMAQLQGIHGIPKRIYGHEIFYSHYTDILPVHVVEDHANVTEFDETNPLQDPIGPSDVWYRSEIRVPTPVEIAAVAPDSVDAGGKNKRKRKSKSSTSQIPSIVAKHPPTCICAKPYTPLPYGTAPMVYCPRKPCRKWYHISCLEKGEHIIKTSTSTLRDLSESGLDLLDPLPQSGKADGAGAPTNSNSIISVSDPSASASRPPPTPDPEPASPRTLVPLKIKLTAQESIIRGTQETGIVGSALKVLLARNIIFKWQNRNLQAPSGGVDLKALIKEWTEKFDNEEEGKDGKGKVEKRNTLWSCPGCKEPI